MPTNRLAAAGSAYLQSAAHQPIHWYPWGAEAFDAARSADKPVLLDIGAVWCHWCHVMDGESYEDPALAELLNEQFVCIKVDRDERPDVDIRYQRAIQAMTGQGGWPLTAFLTPGGEVFYGGTYFPPDGRYGRPGFRTVLESVRQAWHERRDQVTAQAGTIRRFVDEQLDESAAGDAAPALLAEAESRIVRLFDPVHGGFGSQPKFPHPAGLLFLLERWADDPTTERRTIIDRTSQGMARGGIHDHLAGGFHRYSVDAEWIVPHFEKMAYDNSELLRAYVETFSAFGTTEYADVARGIVRWVREVASDPAGGYAASQDADVGLDDDGDYFTWTRDEAAAVLDADELDVAAAYYDIGTAGEMHHNPAKNVLYVAEPLASIAIRTGRGEAATLELLASAHRKLREARAQRTAPFVDRTRYTNWNAMMAGALLRAGAVLDDPWARGHALATLTRLREEAPSPDTVTHTPGGLADLLDDQVQVAAAALDAYEATGDPAWLGWAERLMERVWRDYRDEARGGLYDVARERTGEGLLPSRAKPITDNPTPSANGIAALALARLAELAGGDAWRERAEALVAAFAGGAAELGLHGATFLLAANRVLAPATHLVIVGDTADANADALHRIALAAWLPRRVVQRIAPAELAERALPPALAGMVTTAAGPRAYACSGTQCSAPAASVDAWIATLDGLRSATSTASASGLPFARTTHSEEPRGEDRNN